MLTEEQRRAYDASVSDLIAKAVQNLARARSRRMNRHQRDMAARVEVFIVQSREVRNTDPAAAQSLAARAELLSRELAGQ
jgi:hypothetical protein